MTGKPSLLRDVLVAKYGLAATQTPMLPSFSTSRLASSWWKDIFFVGLTMGVDGDWFRDRVARKVVNREATSFWHDTWLGLQPLSQAFPRLFLASSLQEGSVVDFGSWAEESWIWSLPWRRRLLVWEESLERNLLELLSQFPLLGILTTGCGRVMYLEYSQFDQLMRGLWRHLLRRLAYLRIR